MRGKKRKPTVIKEPKPAAKKAALPKKKIAA
jgi:hypothetical protein